MKTPWMGMAAGWILTMLLLSGAVSAQAAERDYVVILHGIARSSASMETLAEFLDANGFEPVNIDYPSTDHSIEGLIDRVHEKMEGLDLDPQRTTHFVGYSLGGLHGARSDSQASSGPSGARGVDGTAQWGQ